MKSAIKFLKPSDKGDGTYFGFIKTTDKGKDYYFTSKDTDNKPFDSIQPGMNVEFEAVEKDGNRYANKIKTIDKKRLPQKEAPLKSMDYEEYQKTIFAAIKSIDQITDPYEFEKAVNLLIRLLGIHDAFQFDPKNQAGKADGFFILENLAVMYDCTLNTNFDEFKEEQIENYINKLSQKSQITFDIKKPDGGTASKTLQISGKKRQVWIITKGQTRELNDYEGIKVKEISVSDLSKIFSNRTKDWSYDIDRLTSDLILLGS